MRQEADADQPAHPSAGVAVVEPVASDPQARAGHQHAGRAVAEVKWPPMSAFAQLPSAKAMELMASAPLLFTDVLPTTFGAQGVTV